MVTPVEPPEFPEFPEHPEHPEIPYPFPPGPTPPRRYEPVMVPMVDVPSDDVRQRLLQQRRLLVGGPLDGDATAALSAQLMALDGESSDDVEIVVNSEGGPVSSIFAVLDVVELMRARVNTTCVGSARGTAAALVACGTGDRRAAPHATLSLRCGEREMIEGTSSDISHRAEEIAALRSRLTAVIAAAIGLDEAVVVDEIENGREHDAQAALALGIIDAIIEPPTRMPRP